MDINAEQTALSDTMNPDGPPPDLTTPTASAPLDTNTSFRASLVFRPASKPDIKNAMGSKLRPSFQSALDECIRTQPHLVEHEKMISSFEASGMVRAEFTQYLREVFELEVADDKSTVIRHIELVDAILDLVRLNHRHSKFSKKRCTMLSEARLSVVRKYLLLNLYDLINQNNPDETEDAAAEDHSSFEWTTAQVFMDHIAPILFYKIAVYRFDTKPVWAPSAASFEPTRLFEIETDTAKTPNFAAIMALLPMRQVSENLGQLFRIQTFQSLESDSADLHFQTLSVHVDDVIDGWLQKLKEERDSLERLQLPVLQAFFFDKEWYADAGGRCAINQVSINGYLVLDLGCCCT
jgi:hypothetical protein